MIWRWDEFWQVWRVWDRSYVMHKVCLNDCWKVGRLGFLKSNFQVHGFV